MRVARLFWPADMSLSAFVVAALFWLLALALGSVVHELGHALASLLLGHQLVTLRFGSGPWRLYLRRHAPEISVAGPLPLGGFCQSRCQVHTGKLLSCRRRQLIELSAGPMMNFAVGALLLSAVSFCLPIVGAAQLLVGLSQLLPLRGHDGAAIVKLLRKPSKQQGI